MKHYLEEISSVLSHTQSSETGISGTEVTKRIEANGYNELKQEKKQSLISKFLCQMRDPMIIVLLLAAAVSAFTAIYEGEGLADVIIIIAVVLINGVLGVFQESKAEKAIESLQKMSAATSKVLRDGHVCVIDSRELVVGDVVILEAGDLVPADGRIIEAVSLKIEEAALTGESVASNKASNRIIDASNSDIPLGDRKNMIYMGCTVVYGRCKAVITATGMSTEMGKIAGVISQTKEGKTPLQMKLSQLSKVLTYAVIGICIFIFGFKLITTGSFTSAVIMDSFMIAVSLAVAAIPEGLATVVTIVLSIGVTNMAKKNAVIRKLTAVETLGCAQIICSDKTGTLTQNKMTVVEQYTTDKILLAQALAFSSDATLGETFQAVGEPTECAVVNYAYKQGVNVNELNKKFRRAVEAPFDSVRKMMSVAVRDGDNYKQYTKGAPDEVLKQCTHYLLDGKPVEISEQVRRDILGQNKLMASKALRVLAAAYKITKELPTQLEQGLTFIGLVGMIDPVRDEVAPAIIDCKKAGIRPIMITGDHKDTAIAIAKQLGIITDDSQAITGAELDLLSDAEFSKCIADIGVYARVKPENKVRIVNMWKTKGYVCAMTGDGVNDAPSIKSSDIGIGMGITGTDVTKNVADMVLSDDNFATIVGAVKEGRIVFDNIRKSIQFLLSSNLSEVVSIFIATLFGFTILKPVHVLWINLVTDTLPAVALGMEKGESDIMTRKPRDSKQSIFADNLGVDLVWQGIMIALITVSAYFLGHYLESGRWEIVNSPDGTTMAFLTMSMAEIFHSFNMRSRKSIFTMKSHNKYLWLSFVVSLLLTTLVIYVPFLSSAFELESISLVEYFSAMLLSISVIPIVEIVKLIRSSIKKNK